MTCVLYSLKAAHQNLEFLRENVAIQTSPGSIAGREELLRRSIHAIMYHSHHRPNA